MRCVTALGGYVFLHPHRAAVFVEEGIQAPIERINSRVDNSFGFEKHYIRGKGKMTARVGLALAVMMALAVGHIKAGRPECMRSPRAG